MLFQAMATSWYNVWRVEEYDAEKKVSLQVPNKVPFQVPIDERVITNVDIMEVIQLLTKAVKAKDNRDVVTRIIM